MAESLGIIFNGRNSAESAAVSRGVIDIFMGVLTTTAVTCLDTPHWSYVVPVSFAAVELARQWLNFEERRSYS